MKTWRLRVLKRFPEFIEVAQERRREKCFVRIVSNFIWVWCWSVAVLLCLLVCLRNSSLSNKRNSRRNFSVDNRQDCLINSRRPYYRARLLGHWRSSSFSLVTEYDAYHAKNTGEHCCPECCKRYKNLSSLSRHMRYGCGKLKCICPHCGKFYSRTDTLAEHVARKHSLC